MSPAGSVLLDTNVVVAHSRNDPDVTARLRIAPAIYLPWVVLGELHYGALRAQRREAQLALIREFVQTAILRIAAMARPYDLPLATRDVYFAAVSRLKTLAW